MKTRPACFSNLQRNARHAKSRCCAVFRFSSAPDALAFCISLAPYPERMSWLNFVAHVLAPVTHLYYICGRYVAHCLHIAPDLGHIVGTLPADSVTSLAHLWHISDTSLAHLWGECTPLSPQRLSRLRDCRALGPVPQIDTVLYFWKPLSVHCSQINNSVDTLSSIHVHDQSMRMISSSRSKVCSNWSRPCCDWMRSCTWIDHAHGLMIMYLQNFLL